MPGKRRGKAQTAARVATTGQITFSPLNYILSIYSAHGVCIFTAEATGCSQIKEPTFLLQKPHQCPWEVPSDGSNDLSSYKIGGAGVPLQWFVNRERAGCTILSDTPSLR